MEPDEAVADVRAWMESVARRSGAGTRAGSHGPPGSSPMTLSHVSPESHQVRNTLGSWTPSSHLNTPLSGLLNAFISRRPRSSTPIGCTPRPQSNETSSMLPSAVHLALTTHPPIVVPSRRHVNVPDHVRRLGSSTPEPVGAVELCPTLGITPRHPRRGAPSRATFQTAARHPSRPVVLPADPAPSPT